MKSLTTKIEHSSRQPQLFFKILAIPKAVPRNPTPAQTQAIQEAYQVANQRVETSRSNFVKPLPPEHKITGSPFKVTLRQRDPRLEGITGIVPSKRRLSRGVDYRINTSQIPCTVAENGLKVGNESIPLAMIIKVKLAWANMSVDTMMDRNRLAEEGQKKSQLEKELAEINQDLLKTLTTIGLGFIADKMPNFQQALDKATSFDGFKDWIMESRDRFATEMTTALTDSPTTGMITSALRESYVSRFNARLRTFVHGANLPHRFPNVKMEVSYEVTVGDRFIIEPEAPSVYYEGGWKEDGHWVDVYETRFKLVPADKSEFYKRLGLVYLVGFESLL